MKEFLIYFFGKGETEEFHNFTVAHFAPILILVATILLIAKYADKIRNAKCEKNIRYVLAFAMIISEMSYYWRLIALPEILEPSAADHLPITVCGWGIVLCSYMVIGKTQLFFDIVYFWCFAGTIFALITPTVITYTGPTRFRYYQFWVEHTLGFVGIFYMIFVHKMRPTIKSAIRSYIALVALAAVAYYANDLIKNGANYLYMAKPEDTPSILDILPPNFALRLLVMASAVTLLYFLAYLPWLIMDKKAKKIEQSTEEKQTAEV